jgi:hypothetical protein
MFVTKANLTKPNLTRVTTMFGYYLTPAAGWWDQGTSFVRALI